MFGDLNTVSLIGNITKDIEVRYTPNGKAVANFSVATNRSYKLPDSNDWKEDVTFHNIVLFGNNAEMLSQRAKKGTRIFVNGHLQTRSWQDKDGKTNYRTEIVVDKIILLDRYERGQMQQGANNEEGGMPSYEEEPIQTKKINKDENIIDPDDLPF